MTGGVRVNEVHGEVPSVDRAYNGIRERLRSNHSRQARQAWSGRACFIVYLALLRTLLVSLRNIMSIFIFLPYSCYLDNFSFRCVLACIIILKLLNVAY